MYVMVFARERAKGKSENRKPTYPGIALSFSGLDFFNQSETKGLDQKERRLTNKNITAFSLCCSAIRGYTTWFLTNA